MWLIEDRKQQMQAEYKLKCTHISYLKSERTPALPSPPQDATPPLPTAATTRPLLEHPPTKARRPTAGINNPVAVAVVPCPLCLILLMRDRGLGMTASEIIACVCIVWREGGTPSTRFVY